MKKKITIAKLAAVAVVAATLITSCNKTVTPRKLDGEWDVTAGSSSSSTSYTNDGVTTTYSSSMSYDGSVESHSQTSGGVTVTTEVEITRAYTFDKKSGEYTSNIVSTDEEYSTSTYQVYDDAEGNYDWMNIKYVDQVTSRTSTEDASGFFTITGDAGDEIEKNSQIVFQERSRTETYDDTYTYYNSGTETAASVSGKYMYDWNTGNYIPFPTSKSGSEIYSGEQSEATIWNITELKGGEMTVEYIYENNYEDTEDDYKTSSTTEGSWTLTAK